MKGIIKQAGRAALRTATQRAANSLANREKEGRSGIRRSEGGIKLGDPQSLNDLGNTNGFGMIPLPDRPLTPWELAEEGFNPFNIPPHLSIVGVEHNKCGTIVTFGFYALGWSYGKWSLGYRNGACDPLKLPDLPEEPEPPGDYGPGGNAKGWKSRCPDVTILFWDTSSSYNWEHVHSQLEKLENPWRNNSGGSDLRISLHPPLSTSELFDFVALPLAKEVNLPKQIKSFEVGHWVRAFEFYEGSIFAVRLKFNENYLMNHVASSSIINWLKELEPIECYIPGANDLIDNTKPYISKKYLLSPEPGVIYGQSRAEEMRHRMFLYSLKNCPPPQKPGLSGGTLKEEPEMMDECCQEILDSLEEQDEKISRLLDLLDPEGAWPIKVPGQMLQLDNGDAQPLELKSYPELWVAQLATQNRLREVAAPPGAWPLQFPKGIIEPMGTGNLKIQSIGAMLMAILRGLDAKLGPIVNEVELSDGTPLEPGKQKVNLRFFGLSSLACQILQIAIDNEGDIDLSNNLLLRLAMTSAATQKAATQSALQTSEILDALGAKYNDKVEEVPFFFNPQAAAEVAENLQNTEESTEALMAAILDTSTQQIKYLSVDEKRNIVMRLTQMEQAINTIQAGQAVEWDGSKKGLAALMSSYMLIDQIQDYKLKKELKNLDNQGDFGEWSKQHEAGYPGTGATDEYSNTSKPWGRDMRNQPKIRKVDNNPDREQ
ncbi:hypothetical protein NG799_02320 [Laspinema sp. D1]|uniref:Uncharacterized protein n=1 Tax=Laspinema palackyanum D2a TaxID=2953684 RepID=A0ABT2MKC3_9CYAN|nr:hypothetical protein [Laspinema sp. D2a]